MRLFHFSENGQIDKFGPRISKKIWDYKKYVWAISEKQSSNYLFPRSCPRICISGQEINLFRAWINAEQLDLANALIFYPETWQNQVENNKIWRYEFDNQNFTLIDEVAGYYVSKQIEIPIKKIRITNCLSQLAERRVIVKTVNPKKFLEIKTFTLKNTKRFSIIKWNNLQK